MTFYHVLQECGLDWNKAKNIFYGLTDLQVIWMNTVAQKLQDDAEKQSHNKVEKYPVSEKNKISFDLRSR